MGSSSGHCGWRVWRPVVIWCGVIFLMSSLPGGGDGADKPLTAGFVVYVLSRKCAHVFEYGVLYWLIYRAFTQGGTLKGRWATLAAFTLSMLYAVSDELHQTFTPLRHGTPIDVLVDFIGVCIARSKVRDRDD